MQDCISCRVITIVVIFCGFLCPISASATLVWDQVGPVNAAEGLSSLVVDPSDSQTIWVGGSGRVWVSDDGGTTFNLVLQITTYRRSKASLEDAKEESEDPTAGDSTDDEEDEISLLDGGRGATQSSISKRVSRKQARLLVAARIRGGISRIRLIGDRLYVCSTRGLWSISRKARRMGSERVELNGRKAVVTDIVRSGTGLLVATASGLYRIGSNQLATTVRGGLGRRPVYVLYPSSRGVLAASGRGLWREEAGGFRSMGMELGGAVVTDVKVKGERIYAVSGRRLWEIDGASRQLLNVSTLVHAKRMAIQGNGLWIVGGRGAWFRFPAGQLRPHNTGFVNHDLRDVMVVPKGNVKVWVVGRGGLWRLVPETVHLVNKRARKLATLGKDLPNAYVVLEAAQKNRLAHASRIGATKRAVATAWMLPNLKITYAPTRERIEFMNLVPSLGRYLVNEVRVLPVDDEFRLMATWELAPVIFPLLERSSPGGTDTVASEIRRIYRAQEQLRKAVLPLYHAWVRARLSQRVFDVKTVRAALRRHVKLNQIEADLSVYTGGAFPRSKGQSSN